MDPKHQRKRQQKNQPPKQTKSETSAQKIINPNPAKEEKSRDKWPIKKKRGVKYHGKLVTEVDRILSRKSAPEKLTNNARQQPEARKNTNEMQPPQKKKATSNSPQTHRESQKTILPPPGKTNREKRESPQNATYENTIKQEKTVTKTKQPQHQ
ncbi:hypothetical protein SAMN05660776_2585 [Salegentibacter holothuriorum]|uniref:Uncharacterized protein n=1 Tax=Salegentibacter holothuriorum TaxID=241145 RepID=A0A1T5DES2_9FLAO|nr:hypothetical protein SAMN05660776_2585 [Salegentibacter holothuriorum]